MVFDFARLGLILTRGEYRVPSLLIYEAYEVKKKGKFLDVFYFAGFLLLKFFCLSSVCEAFFFKTLHLSLLNMRRGQ